MMADQEDVVSATEALADELILVALLLLRFNAHLRRQALLRLEELRDEILRALATVDLTGPDRFAVAASFDATMVPMIQAGYSRIDAEIGGELLALVGLISEVVADRVDAMVAPGIGQTLSPEIQRLTAANALIDGATVPAWLSSQAGNLAFALRRNLNAAAAHQAGPTEITKAVRETIETAQRQAMPVVRTAVTAAFGVAMVAIVGANQKTMRGFVHVSVLDSRITETCKRRAGARFLADGTPVGHGLSFRVPPLHLGCRSHLAPWFYSAAEMHSSAAVAIRKSGREAAFNDRSIPDPELGEWLTRRTVGEQQAILGKAKWEAWKAGTITTAALLDQSARPLTLDQIRRRLGL